MSERCTRLGCTEIPAHQTRQWFLSATALLLGLTLGGISFAENKPQRVENEPDAEELTSDACLLQELKSAKADATVEDIQQLCLSQATAPDQSLVLQRMQRERAVSGIRSILTPHNRNYLMPVSYLGDANADPYIEEFPELPADGQLSSTEIKFQLSLKFNIVNDLLLENDSVHFGFTGLSFWQAYNSDVSAPFRETNYEPELFWTAPFDFRPLGLNASVLSLGFSHQSNGRGGSLSRSWNRIYANFTWEKNRWVFNLKPWYRIPEEEKDSPEDPTGDDNPDLERYLGHFEFTTLYRERDHEFSLMLRNNLRSKNRGAVQLEYTFPLWRGIRGFAQYFNGYGESLIDYNANIERFGIGILLSDIL